ncbi:MAG: hypothetical protein SNJ84_04905 [Verrucomicrobiia bacterium]
MKRIAAVGWMMGLGWVSWAEAGLGVALSSERSHFLLYEAALFDVELTNQGLRPVELVNRDDGKQGWLSFSILRPNNVRVRTDIPFEPPDRVLQPGETARLRVNITPHYAIRETGEYRIQAVVRQPGQLPLMTAPLTFTVGRGERFWTMDRRMPDDSVRTYSLIRFLQDKSLSPHLYLQIEDAGNNLVFTTANLGPIVARETPKTLFDARGGFHLSWSNAPKTYRYVACDPDGRILRQDQRVEGATFPALRMTQAGEVEFVGGAVPGAQPERARLSQVQAGAGGTAEGPTPEPATGAGPMPGGPRPR